ncbi:MAG TPA: DUF445 domain-containing protein [Acidimicrobiia bacterium]
MSQPPLLPPIRQEDARLRALRAMKRRATGLLVLMTALYVVLTVAGDGSTWLDYAQAGAGAAMVGGLADWFAVTALFRHPLGLPIPHTAVIAERKDQFGETLGDFVQENFLSPAVLSERVRSSRAVARAVAWLAEEEHAEAVAAHAADVVVALADSLRDEDVAELLEAEARRAVEAVPLAAWAARVVRLMTTKGRHQELVDTAVRALGRLMADNRALLKRRFTEQAPWWLPDRVDARIFDRLANSVEDLLRDVYLDPDHQVRGQVNQWVTSLAARLERSPELAGKLEQLKKEFLEQPELGAWTSSLWTNFKGSLRTQAADPESQLRRQLAKAIAAGARRVRDDPELLARVERMAETWAYTLAERFREEAAELVSGTIARWDAQETAAKLELLLGRDLQFIRINGTVVGGIAGLVIHAVGDALG